MGLFNRAENYSGAINAYKKAYMEHSPCEEGVEAFSSCRTRKDLFELAQSPIAVDFFMRSLAEEWGPDTDTIENVFRPFINGAMTVRREMENRVIRTQMWCKSDLIQIDDSVRWVVLVGCRGRVEVRDWQVVKIFVDRCSDIELVCGQNSIVRVENYGGRVKDVNKNAKIKSL